MKKYLLTILILTSLVLTGCLSKPQTNQNTNMVVDPSSVIPEESGIQETATTTEEIDTSDWKTYRNEEYGFEISFPGDWSYKEFDRKTELSYGFFVSNGVSRFTIFPEGEFGYGLPWSERTTSEVIISGKLTILNIWPLNNGGELWVYQLIEGIPNWITCDRDLKKSCNRIDFLANDQDDLKILKRILSTFTFR